LRLASAVSEAAPCLCLRDGTGWDESRAFGSRVIVPARRASDVRLGAPPSRDTAVVRFGWNYDNSCSVRLDDLFAELAAGFNGGGDTVIYELFLQARTARRCAPALP
jgi:hypothetical protein